MRETVLKSHLVIAKITVLFLFSVAYELLGFCIGILIALLNISTFIPVPMVFRWLYQFKVPEGKIMTDFYNRLSPYFVSTPIIFAILIAEAIVCIVLVTRVYQKQEV